MKRIAVLIAVLVLSLICSCGGEDNPCPDGGEQIGTVGIEQWCALDDGRGGYTLHGPYEKWAKGKGYLFTRGQYCHGNICGTWHDFRDTGDIVREYYFTDLGYSCGDWTSYDEDGNYSIYAEHPACPL